MESYCFKHWSKKNYAVFASLHRVIRIGTLSFACLILQVQPGFSQADTTAPVMFYELEEVESTSETEVDIYSPSLRNIITITKQEISSSPAPSLDQLLDALPLTDIRTRGYHGIQSDLNLQGGSFDQSIVLLNGINISDPQTGHFSLDLPLSVQQLDRLEVMVGPATKTYGLNAYSGAVNLVTIPSDTMNISAELKAGHYNYYQANAAMNLPIGPFKTMLSFNSGGSDGYRPNTDYDQWGLFLHSVLELPWLDLDVMAGANRKNFGANSFYTPRFPEQYEETGMQILALKVATRSLHPVIKGDLSWRRHSDHFLLFRNDPSFYQNFHQTDVFEGNLNLSYSWLAGVSKAGISLRSEQIISSSLGEELEVPLPVKSADSAYYNFGTDRLQPGLFINHVLQRGRLKLSGGMLMQSSPADPKVKFYPGMDLNIRLSNLWNFTAAINRSMRLPTFTDLYYRGPQNIGNAQLKPEEATTYETGLSFTAAGISARMTFFYRRGKETIDWVWMEDEKWHTMNITDLHTRGGEISVTLDPEKIFGVPSFLKSVSSSYSYTDINKSSDSYVSHYALDNLKHKWVGSADIRLPYHFSVRYGIRYFDRNGFFLSYDPESGLSEELPYEQYFLNDLSLRFTRQGFTASLEVLNLFGKEYIDLGNLPQPGRWVIGGVKINL